MLPNSNWPKVPCGTKNVSTVANVIVHWTQHWLAMDLIRKSIAVLATLNSLGQKVILLRKRMLLECWSKKHIKLYIYFLYRFWLWTLTNLGFNKRWINNRLVSICFGNISFQWKFFHSLTKPNSFHIFPNSPDGRAFGGQKVNGPNGCKRCGFAVYEAEKMLSKGKLWHKRCFSCSDCHKSLDSTNLCDAPDAEIYCRPCYGRLWGPKGVGFGMGAGCLSMA